jgi:hypothetical protein
MSNLQKTIGSVISEFITHVSKKYDLDVGKVRRTCSGTASPAAPSIKTLQAYGDALDLVEESLEKNTVAKLKEMCRVKGLTVSGKKAELIEKIRSGKTGTPKKTGKVGNTGKEVKTIKKSTKKGLGKKKLDNTVTVSKIVEKLRGSASTLDIVKNAQGHYVFENLVFNPHNSHVYAGWKDNTLQSLTKVDLVRCKELGLPYDLPENLDHGTTKIDDSAVQEVLDEEDFKSDVEDDAELPSDDENA